MTPGEREVWIAVWAAYWRSPAMTCEGGVLGDGRSALDAARQARRAVQALRGLAENAVQLGDAELQADTREVLGVDVGEPRGER